ncbi:PadR family transcriptional regulator [Cellulomonas soli]
MPAELSAVAVLALALLHERPMHPYQVHQTLTRRGDTRLVRVNPGAVYHAVERLERDGLARTVGTDRDGRRPERTTYEITPAGREAFADRVRGMLGEDHPAYPLFTVGLAECHELPEPDVTDALTRRHARIAARLDEMLHRYHGIRDRGLPRHYLLDVEYEIAHLRTELDWLQRTLHELTTRALDWDAPLPEHLVQAARTLDPDAPTPTETPR